MTKLVLDDIGSGYNRSKINDNFQKIEDESKKWFIVCDKCGYSISYWDAGGIRAGAASWKKKVFGRCPTCKKFRFFSVIKKD